MKELVILEMQNKKTDPADPRVYFSAKHEPSMHMVKMAEVCADGNMKNYVLTTANNNEPAKNKIVFNWKQKP